MQNVLPALALVLIAIGVSVYLSLGLHKPLAIAAARSAESRTTMHGRMLLVMQAVI